MKEVNGLRLASKSRTPGATLVTFVGKTATSFVRTGIGLEFCVVVPEDSVGDFAKGTTRHRLLAEPRLAGGVVIGRVWSDDGTAERFSQETSWWPIVEDKLLRFQVHESAQHLVTLLSRYSRWGSLASFLKTVLAYDVGSQSPTSQYALDYWWLVAPADPRRSVFPVSIYGDNRGVFVRPEDHLLPVFSSSLYADMTGQLYRDAHGVDLTPEPLGCLGCFLSGSSGEIGRANLLGALLDEEWRIHYLTCDESPGRAKARHFMLRDAGGVDYLLAGCPDLGSRAV